MQLFFTDGDCDITAGPPSVESWLLPLVRQDAQRHVVRLSELLGFHNSCSLPADLEQSELILGTYDRSSLVP